jgi:PAS domain S-box-containing protein
MSNTEKSRDELLQELQELRKENQVFRIAYQNEITERKRVEEKLLFMNKAIDSASDAIGISNAQGHHFYQNKSLSDLFEYESAEEIEALGGGSIVVKNPNVAKEMFDNIMSGKSWSGELEMISKSGKIIQAFERANAIIDNDGNIQGLIGIITDITQRRIAEDALSESQSLYRDLVETSQDLIWQCDSEGRYIYLNPAWEQVFGYKINEMLGKTFTDFQTPEQAELDMIEFSKLLLGNSIKGLETVHIGKAGNDIHLVFNSKFVLDKDGKIIGTRGTAFDITERKLSEERLRKSEENLFITLHSIGDGVITTNNNGLIDRMNPVALKLCGWSELDVKDKPLSEVFKIINSDTRETVADPVKKVLECGQVVGLANHTILISKDGYEYQIADSAAPIKNKDGTISGVVLVFSDVTEKYIIEKNLRESELKYRSLIESSTEVIFCINQQGEYQFTNDIFAATLGKVPDYFIGKNYWDIYPKKHADYRQAITSKVFDTGKTESFEVEVPLIDKTLYFIGKANPIKDENGNVVLVLVNSTDITERKKIEDELIKSEEKFRSIINVSPVPMALNDENQNITFLNPAFINTFGYTPEDIPTLSDWWPKAYPDPDYRQWVADSWQNELEHAKLTGTSFTPMELTVKCKNGNNKTVLASASSIINLFEGNHLVLLYDISDRKLTETEIQMKNIELSELNASKDKFFSIVAHDLRSPFNGFLGLTRMMSENIHDFTLLELQEISKDMQASASNLFALLENLLEWSRMQRGVTEFNIETCNLSSVINKNIDLVNEYSKQKNIEIKIAIAEEFKISADLPMLNTILRNLISNAIKFTPRGGKIEIGTSFRPSEGYIIHPSGGYEIYVKDTGIGMNEETIRKLFRIDRDISHKGTDGEASTGLGLILCKEFVEKHGGNIRVESEVGKGSTFYFSL